METQKKFRESMGYLPVSAGTAALLAAALPVTSGS